MSGDTHLDAPTMFDGAAAPRAEAVVLDASPAEAVTPEPQADVLTFEVRRALVQLLRHGVVLARSHAAAFEALRREQQAIKAHLANQFLDVLVDESRGVMLLRQLQVEQGEDGEDADAATSLLPTRTMTLYQTLVVLVLRRFFQEREAAGEQQVIVDIERIEAALRPFLPLTQSSSIDRKRLSGALERMREHRILSGQRGADDRFEISPVIRYVVSAEVLEELLARYAELAHAHEVDVEAAAP